MVVKLTTSGMNYNPEMESTPREMIFVWFEVGESTPSLDFGVRMHMSWIQILRPEDKSDRPGHASCC